MHPLNQFMTNARGYSRPIVFFILGAMFALLWFWTDENHIGWLNYGCLVGSLFYSSLGALATYKSFK